MIRNCMSFDKEMIIRSGLGCSVGNGSIAIHNAIHVAQDKAHKGAHRILNTQSNGADLHVSVKKPRPLPEAEPLNIY